MGGPVAWFIQLVVDFGLTSDTCFPRGIPRGSVLPGWGRIHLALLLINIAALIIALVAATVAWRSWRATRREHPGTSDELLEAGEGRTRFLAAWGLITGLGFFGAILFALIALVAVPPCHG
jgi:hypothetical protein